MLFTVTSLSVVIEKRKVICDNDVNLFFNLLRSSRALCLDHALAFSRIVTDNFSTNVIEKVELEWKFASPMKNEIFYVTRRINHGVYLCVLEQCANA